MTYIAEITSNNRLTKKAIALLLCQKRPDGLWVSVASEEVIVRGMELNERQLILLDLYSNRSPLSVVSASKALVECLHAFTLRLTQFDTKEAGIEAFKESLELQAIQLRKREENLKQREEFQRQEEQKLQIVREKTEIQLRAVETQREALTRAWEHIQFRENELEENSRKS